MKGKPLANTSPRKGKHLSKAEKATRAAARKAKRQEAVMVGPVELAAALGVGINQAYDCLIEKKVPAIRVGRRWLISRKTIERIANGEPLTPVAA